MTDTTSTNGSAPAGSAAAHAIPAAELSELMDAAVRRAVGVKFAEAAKTIAAEVVESVLTPEIREQMAETAAHEAELALNPPVSMVEPEPEPQQDSAPAEEPQRLYASVYEFVEDYVAQVYRREVTGRSSDRTRRWCPQWWRHGEARGRLKALWMAFESLRQGETVEQSVFWINHFTPHMNALFDTEGPFKFCSAIDGHQTQNALVALPVVPWPGDDEDADQPGPVHPSGLVLPQHGTVHHRRVVQTTKFP